MAKTTHKKEQTKNKGLKPGFWVIYVAVVITMLSVFGVGMASSFMDNKDLTAKKAELENDIEEEEKRNDELSMEGDYYKSDEYYEKIAREKLGLVMPNEITFIDQNK